MTTLADWKQRAEAMKLEAIRRLGQAEGMLALVAEMEAEAASSAPATTENGADVLD